MLVENFTDSGALWDALRYHYPGLPEDAAVAVVRVRTDLTERNRRWRSAG
jgi:hypothetical protein